MNDIQIPLCVQMDGTLTPVNTAHEKLLMLVKHSPKKLLGLLGALLRGPRAFWRTVTAAGRIDLESLPLRHELIEWLRDQRAQGRRLVLLAGRDPDAAAMLAENLKVFDYVCGAASERGRRAQAGRDDPVRLYGAGGFDYVGNDADRRPVGRLARRIVFVGDAQRGARIARAADVARVFPTATPSPRAWIKALRLHQWVKNTLIFVPALLAHTLLRPQVALNGVLAFCAFGFCASSVYILNDLFDLTSDRAHPRKRHRPFASGVLSARSGVVAAGVLFLAAVATALTVNFRFIAVLAGYYLLTSTYSLWLKRIGMVDVMALAGLYTTRIVAGAAATSVPLSFWLLAFSIFMFLSLGFVKRYAELDGARRSGGTGGSGRGYSSEDLPLIMSLGTASGYCSVVVMALYLNSKTAGTLYHHQKVLWLVCPLVLYWISRVWTQTSRGLMHDDPVVFALRDWVSLIVFAMAALTVLIAI